MSEGFAGDVPTNTPLTTAANYVQTQPWVYTPSPPIWSIVGRCGRCDFPLLANLQQTEVPVVFKTCTCSVLKKRKRRKSKLAADGLPRVTPDVETTPMFNDAA